MINSKGLAFELINNGTAYRVRKGTVSAGDVIIPASYNDTSASKTPGGSLPVMEIGSGNDISVEDGAFYETKITSITIPAGVTTIGQHAFLLCENLASVTIPASVISIGDKAIRSGLYNSSIGYVFAGCSRLTSIKVDANNPRFSSEGGMLYNKAKTLLLAYPGAKGNVKIPEGVLVLFEIAFHGSKMNSITIPASVTEIGEAVFCYNFSLSSVNFAAGSHLKTIGYNAFNGCKSLTSITIPDGVKSIEFGAFSDCASLASIKIPASVTFIGDDAFEKTAWLKKQPDGLVYAGKFLYKYKGTMSDNTVINNIRADTVAIVGGAFSWCENLTGVTIPSGVTFIGNLAFSFCENLTSITIPSSVTFIGENAFYGCTGLTSVTIPSGVTTIGQEAFRDCSNIKSITIPASVKHVGKWAFHNWTSSQTINVHGKANQAADAAWDADWRSDCNALINYLGG